MPRDVNKTPSYLKGLAERRARAAADIERLERLQRQLANELEAARRVQLSCDTLIRDFNPELDPGVIQPVRATKGKYGGYGKLAATALAVVRSASPAAVSTAEIALCVEGALELEFASLKERRKWFQNVLRRALYDHSKEGIIERIDELCDENDRSSRWRLVARQCSTLDELRAHAAEKGVVVTEGVVEQN